MEGLCGCTCCNIKFLATLSFSVWLLLVDKANMRSSQRHPIKLAAVDNAAKQNGEGSTKSVKAIA